MKSRLIIDEFSFRLKELVFDLFSTIKTRSFKDFESRILKQEAKKKNPFFFLPQQVSIDTVPKYA